MTWPSQRTWMRVIVWVLVLDIVLGITLAALGLSMLIVAIIRAVWR